MQCLNALQDKYGHQKTSFYVYVTNSECITDYQYQFYKGSGSLPGVLLVWHSRPSQ